MKDTEVPDNERSCSCCSVDLLEERPPLWKRQTLLTAAAGGIVLAAGLLMNVHEPFRPVSLLLFVIVTAVAGRGIFWRALRSLKRLRLDMNCLMSIAAFGAFSIGHAEEGAAVIYLFFVAEALEEYAGEKARDSMVQLLKLAPETAIVRRGGGEAEVHVHEIGPGEVIAVRPGQKIPLDGTVVTGHSSVDESPITGESVPVEKVKGDEVFAGTLNEQGYLEVKVSRRADDTVLAKIIRLVEEAEQKKSATEKFIDRFARVYSPVVISIAVATFIVPVIFLGYPAYVWFYRALVLLVVSCPCALAISTPVAMVSAITSAARHGVLIRGATFIEKLDRTGAFAFDKTGTITKGRLEVTDVTGLGGNSAADVLMIAASLESRSGHPIARAIVRKALSEGVGIKEISDFRAIMGKGIRAGIEGRTYYAGAKNMFDELSVPLPNGFAGYESGGRTAIFIADEAQAIGVIVLGDVIRDNAADVVSYLNGLGVRTEMLTGDNREAASAVAAETGMQGIHAGLLPEDKLRVVAALAQRYGSVAMIGDGVNDAPALAAADVGIAMGTIGSDAAIETADIALMHDDLSKIEYLMLLSRKTMRVVKQNITVSLLVKGSFTALAVLGYINLWVAVGAGDMGLTLIVILNAMRLTRVKARSHPAHSH